MIENIMTNEQKLDEIYQIIKAQESRATRAKWFRLLKWIILLGLAYFIAKNPGLFLDKITELVMPTIMENMKTMMTEDLMKQVQDAFPKQ
ncbi:MAG: hypothetical protein WAW59_04560 [Patescibacteria group bacterium]